MKYLSEHMGGGSGIDRTQNVRLGVEKTTSSHIVGGKKANENQAGKKKKKKATVRMVVKCHALGCLLHVR